MHSPVAAECASRVDGRTGTDLTPCFARYACTKSTIRPYTDAFICSPAFAFMVTSILGAHTVLIEPGSNVFAVCITVTRPVGIHMRTAVRLDTDLPTDAMAACERMATTRSSMRQTFGINTQLTVDRGSIRKPSSGTKSRIDFATCLIEADIHIDIIGSAGCTQSNATSMISSVVRPNIPVVPMTPVIVTRSIAVTARVSL